MRGNPSGFALIEIMVASSLLVVVALGTASSMVARSKLGARQALSHDVNEAAALARLVSDNQEFCDLNFALVPDLSAARRIVGIPALRADGTARTVFSFELESLRVPRPGTSELTT